VDTLGKVIGELQALISAAAGVEVKAAVEEGNAEAVITRVQMQSTIADKDKRTALAILDKEKAIEQGQVRAYTVT
jgi:precorrin-4 methylase